MKKISEGMLIGEILELDTRFAEILKKHGLNCSGCPAAQRETLSEAVKGYEANIDNIIKDLNQCFSPEKEE